MDRLPPRTKFPNAGFRRRPTCLARLPARFGKPAVIVPVRRPGGRALRGVGLRARPPFGPLPSLHFACNPRRQCGRRRIAPLNRSPRFYDGLPRAPDDRSRPSAPPAWPKSPARLAAERPAAGRRRQEHDEHRASSCQTARPTAPSVSSRTSSSRRRSPFWARRSGTTTPPSR